MMRGMAWQHGTVQVICKGLRVLRAWALGGAWDEDFSSAGPITPTQPQRRLGLPCWVESVPSTLFSNGPCLAAVAAQRMACHQKKTKLLNIDREPKGPLDSSSHLTTGRSN